jgi:hypothetical protein
VVIFDVGAQDQATGPDEAGALNGFAAHPDVVAATEPPASAIAEATGPEPADDVYSNACAVVASVCSLILFENSTLRAEQVRRILVETASETPGGLSDWMRPKQVGRIDARRAVMAAGQMPGARALLVTGDESGAPPPPGGLADVV